MIQTKPTKMWQLTIMVPAEGALAFQEGFPSGPLASSFHEVSSNVFVVTHLYDAPPERFWVDTLIKQLSRNMGWNKTPLWQISELPETDWVAENQNHFPPIKVDPFFIYSTFFKEALPEDAYLLQVDAAQAFGTGEHETTAGCLLSMVAHQQKNQNVQHILDFGCGTSILAMGAAYLWPDATIIGIDNDQKAVDESIKNITLNKMKNRISVALNDTPAGPYPFDLIIANVLLSPLLALCTAIDHALSPDGTLILSGILETQVPALSAAYEKLGYTVQDVCIKGDWAIVTLAR